MSDATSRHVKGMDRDQTLLLPETIDKYIDEGNEARFIDAFVDSLDLHLLGFTYTHPNEEGRPPYDPADLLKLYIWGYLNQVRSSRKLERECHRNLEAIWLLRKLAPDHKTIADFRRDNVDSVKGVFKEFAKLCIGLDLIGARFVAMDGVKLRLGINEHEKRNKLYLNSLGGVKADFFIVHAKTTVQESSEPEDYPVFPECIEVAGGTPIIANGGVDSAEKVRTLIGLGAAGAMIGRAALCYPSIFDALKNDLGFNEPGRIVPSIDELVREYDSIHERLSGNKRYRNSFLRVAGRKAGSVAY